MPAAFYRCGQAQLCRLYGLRFIRIACKLRAVVHEAQASRIARFRTGTSGHQPLAAHGFLLGLAAMFLTPLLCLGQTLPPLDDTAMWNKHVVYQGAPCMTAIAADFTGDGLVDIICNADRTTRLLVGPDWREIVLDDDPQHNFIHSEVFDVDGDGDLDYLAARYNPGKIVWFEQPNKPLEEKWRLRVVSQQVHGIHGLLRGDVDGDGKMDLLATSAQAKPPHPESLAWFSIPADPHLSAEWPCNVFADQDAPGLTHYLGLGDVNADGRPDAATGAKGGSADPSGKGEWFAWWEAPEDPTQAWKKHPLPGKHPGATNIHPADVNGDGKMDFVASRGHGVGLIWFEAPDWQIHTIHPTIQEPHCLGVVDMDNDGDVDVVTCAFGSKLAAWFENDGRGQFQTHIVGRDQEAYDIRTVDIDADGDLDLLVAGRGSKNVVWYENPANKQLQAPNP